MSSENRYQPYIHLAVTTETNRAIKDAMRIYNQIIEQKNEEIGGGCSIVSLVFLFDYESLVLSQEHEYQDSKYFFERFNELAEERGLTTITPNSSGHFLSLIESDDFKGCLIVTETKRNAIGHVLAVRPCYLFEEKDKEEYTRYSKGYAVMDIGRVARSGLRQIEEMPSLYSESVVVDLLDGGYVRGVFVLLASEASKQ